MQAHLTVRSALPLAPPPASSFARFLTACLPCLHRSNALLSDSILKVFVCFAVGGLLGDAFLHLIPHAINPHSHSSSSPPSPFIAHLSSLLPFSLPSLTPSSSSHSHDSHSPSHSHTDSHASHDHGHSHGHSHGGEAEDTDARGQRAGLLVLTGMLIFFLIEKAARLRMSPSSSPSAHSHSHGPAQAHNHKGGKEDAEVNGEGEEDGPAATVLRRRRTRNGSLRNVNSPSRSPSMSPPPEGRNEGTAKAQGVGEGKSGVALVGLLNLIADLSHNFTDGLAISASFLSSPAVGVSTTLAVLIHEVPHELGDFAILMQAGYTLQQALWFQLATALGAVLGVAVVWVGGGGEEGGMDWVLPVTAGGFIYVALTNVVPGVLKEEEGVSESGRWLQALAQVTAMGVGVGLMVLIGLLE